MMSGDAMKLGGRCEVAPQCLLFSREALQAPLTRQHKDIIGPLYT